MKIVLSGGGSADQSRLVDEFFRGLLPNKKVLFIPQAAVPEMLSIEEVRKWIDGHEAFNDISIHIQEKISELTEEKINSYDAVYLGGGNTFKLLHELRKNNLLELVERFIENPEKVVYGLSAGAILLGKNITTASLGELRDENYLGLKDLSAMDRLNGYLVHAHYNEKEDKEVFKFSKEESSPIICVPETAGVFFDGKKAKAIGYDPVAIFEGDKKLTYEPGEEFEVKR